MKDVRHGRQRITPYELLQSMCLTPADNALMLLTLKSIQKGRHKTELDIQRTR